MKEQRCLVHVIKQRQANWIGHVLRHDCLLKTVLEGKMEGKRTRGKPRRKMLDLLMEQEDKQISYQELKRRAEDRIQWHRHQLNLPYGRAHKKNLTGKPEQQRFTMWSGLLTSISSRQCSAISGHPLPKWMNFGSALCSSTDPSMPQSATLWPIHPAMFSGNDHYFSSEYYQVLIAARLATQEWWKAELAWAPQV